MSQPPKLRRLEERIRRSKRSGKLVMGGVLLISIPFAVVLVQGVRLALEAERSGPAVRGFLGLGLLVGLNLFSFILIRRQHRMLDEAKEDLIALVEGDL